MKKLSLIILFLTICFNLKAQVVNIDTIKTPSIRLTSSSTERNNSFYHYSIAFKLYGLEQFPKILKQENYSDFVSTPLSGIVFKINDNQISYRFQELITTKIFRLKTSARIVKQQQGILQIIRQKLDLKRHCPIL